jgi:hypothetical protein
MNYNQTNIFCQAQTPFTTDYKRLENYLEDLQTQIDNLDKEHDQNWFDHYCVLDSAYKLATGWYYQLTA